MKMLGEVVPGSEAIFLSGMLAALGGVGAVIGLCQPRVTDGPSSLAQRARPGLW